MGSAGSFEENDRQSARNLGAAAKAEGVELIIYLGALGNDGETLSPHLKSRQEVGHILRASGVPVLEFRASIVIGSGSLSFEMIRSLVECLPIMITPKWVSSPAQPIAIDDLLAYLTKALSCRSLQVGYSRLEEQTRSLTPDHARIRSSTGDAHSHDPSASADAVFIEPVVGSRHPFICPHWSQAY